jgi:hypothetical protein
MIALHFTACIHELRHFNYAPDLSFGTNVNPDSDRCCLAASLVCTWFGGKVDDYSGSGAGVDDVTPKYEAHSDEHA